MATRLDLEEIVGYIFATLCKRNGDMAANNFSLGKHLALGLAIGIALGLALDHIAVGVGIGIAIGFAFSQRRKRPDD